MRVAVALTTCGRYDYTARTLASFAHHNDLSRFVLLHGDDASPDRKAISKLARGYGFQTVIQHRRQRGWLPLRTHLITVAANAAPWVLMLENDIESLRPFPWPLFQMAAAMPSVYCLRLYGEFKGPKQRQPCKTTHQWRANAPVTWDVLPNAPEAAEMAQIHWGAQPCVTRSANLVAVHNGHRELDLQTVRVVENVMVHIGKKKTPGFAREVEC